MTSTWILNALQVYHQHHHCAPPLKKSQGLIRSRTVMIQQVKRVNNTLMTASSGWTNEQILFISDSFFFFFLGGRNKYKFCHNFYILTSTHTHASFWSTLKHKPTLVFLNNNSNFSVTRIPEKKLIVRAKHGFFLSKPCHVFPIHFNTFFASALRVQLVNICYRNGHHHHQVSETA